MRLSDQYDTKERSDLAFVFGQYLLKARSKDPDDSSVRVQYAVDGIKLLEYTCEWRGWNKGPGDVLNTLASLHALIEAYRSNKRWVEDTTLKLIQLRFKVLDLHLKNRPGGLSGLLDAREALSDELRLGKSYELSWTQKSEIKERGQRVIEVLKNETQEALGNSRTADPVIKLRSRLELGKDYVDNDDKASFKLAIPVLTEVAQAGTRSTPEDQLRYVSDAIENLVIVYTKLNRDDEAHEMRRKKNKLDSYLGGWHKELSDWLRTRSGR